MCSICLCVFLGPSYVGSADWARIDEPGITLLTGSYEFPETLKIVETGSPTYPRHYHASVSLSDGRVLIAGGVYNVEAEEIFDINSNSFSSTGKLNVTRRGHSGNLLPDGTVLFIGGNITGTVGDAEKFDPTSGRSVFAGQMHYLRVDHMVEPLNDGRFLIVGGGFFPPEIYDPQTETFFVPEYSGIAHAYGASVRLSDQTILIAGGRQMTLPQAITSDLYLDATGEFTKTGDMQVGRDSFQATNLGNGRVLITGGSTDQTALNRSFLKSVEIYDNATGKFTQLHDLVVDRGNHTSNKLPNGSVLLVGGFGAGITTTNAWLAQMEMYNPFLGTSKLFTLANAPRIFHTVTQLPNSDLLIFGGVDERNPSLGMTVTHRVSWVPANVVTASLHLPNTWITQSIQNLTITIDAERMVESFTLTDADETSVSLRYGVAHVGQTQLVTRWDFGDDGFEKRVTLAIRDAMSRTTQVVTGRVRIDSLAPVSFLNLLPELVTNTATLTWSGTDLVSGVASYDIQMKEWPSGSWTEIAHRIPTTTYPFSGESGKIYAFRIRAIDVAGNVEEWPAQHETITYFLIEPTPIPIPTPTPTQAPSATQVPCKPRCLARLPVVVKTQSIFDDETGLGNDTFEHAQGPLVPSVEYIGILDDSNDYFWFNLSSRSNVEISLAIAGVPIEPLDLQLVLRSADNAHIANDGTGSANQSIKQDLGAGTYLLQIYDALHPTMRPYSLTVRVLQ